MELLQATMPHWWAALGLPKDAWPASDWLYEGGRRDTKHYNQSTAERYEGVCSALLYWSLTLQVKLGDLRAEDEADAAWLPDLVSRHGDTSFHAGLPSDADSRSRRYLSWPSIWKVPLISTMPMSSRSRNVCRKSTR
jgi:hypothetical protein